MAAVNFERLVCRTIQSNPRKGAEMSENVSDEQHGRDSGKLTRRDLIASVGVAAAGASAANAWLFSTPAVAHTTTTTNASIPANNDPRVVLMERLMNHHFTRGDDADPSTIKCPYEMEDGRVIWTDGNAHDNWVRNTLANFAPDYTHAIRDDIEVNGNVLHRGTGQDVIDEFAGRLYGLLNHARNANLAIFPVSSGSSCDVRDNLYDLVKTKLAVQCNHCRGHGWAECVCHSEKDGIVTDPDKLEDMLQLGARVTGIGFLNLAAIYIECKDGEVVAENSHESY
jgi:hypothetical protein